MSRDLFRCPAFSFLFLLLAPAGLAAQTEDVEVEPVTCWWRSSAAAVRVGEPFHVLLTCAFLQADAARVVADESRLEPSVVQLPPFEVIGGARAKDVVTATRRFVQYDYRLQLLGDSAFASEVVVPAVQVSYRVESNVGGRESLAGRDLVYALPPIPLRLLSLVPDTATDIREAPVASFSEIESIGVRGTMVRVGAGILMALGALTAVAAVLGGWRRRRTGGGDLRRTLAPAAVLHAVRRELEAVRADARASAWTAELAGRALAALRIVAAYALGRTVTQRETTTPTSDEGQVVVRRRGGRPMAVSAATSGAPATGGLGGPHDEELREALARFAAARYGRAPAFDARLDEGIEAGIAAADRLVAQRPVLERLWAR